MKKGDHEAALTLLKKSRNQDPAITRSKASAAELEKLRSAALRGQLEELRKESAALKQKKRPEEMEKFLGKLTDLEEPNNPAEVSSLLNEVFQETTAAIAELELQKAVTWRKQKEFAKAYEFLDNSARDRELFRKAPALKGLYLTQRYVVVNERLDAARAEFVALVERDDYPGIAALIKDLETNWVERAQAVGGTSSANLEEFMRNCRFYLKVAESAHAGKKS
jgi:hypothetical protein